MGIRVGLVLLLAVAGIVSVACGSDEREGEPTPDDPLTKIASTEGTPGTPVVTLGSPEGSSSAGGAMGPGISVSDAVASTEEGPLLVNGLIFTMANEVWLCSSLPRAEYPTCGEPAIQVSGVDLESVAGMEYLEGRGWSDQPTQVLGEKLDGALNVPTETLNQ